MDSFLQAAMLIWQFMSRFFLDLSSFEILGSTRVYLLWFSRYNRWKYGRINTSSKAYEIFVRILCNETCIEETKYLPDTTVSNSFKTFLDIIL